jgi:hypothetical protein
LPQQNVLLVGKRPTKKSEKRPYPNPQSLDIVIILSSTIQISRPSAKRRGAMKCSYLSRTHIFSCIANNGVYTPSLFEIEEFCLNNKCKMCPRPSLMKFGIVHAGDGEKKVPAQSEMAA